MERKIFERVLHKFFFAISAKVRKCTEVGLLVSGADTLFYQKIKMKFQNKKLKCLK